MFIIILHLLWFRSDITVFIMLATRDLLFLPDDLAGSTTGVLSDREDFFPRGRPNGARGSIRARAYS